MNNGCLYPIWSANSRLFVGGDEGNDGDSVSHDEHGLSVSWPRMAINDVIFAQIKKEAKFRPDLLRS